MSLNSIKFETTDIALLFKNTLVDVDEKKQEPPARAPETVVADTEWTYLGDNRKKTLVIVRYADVVHLPDKQLTFLTKLLAACNLNLADVAIFNFERARHKQLNEILASFNPKVVLLFATKPGEVGMPMNFPDFQVQPFNDVVFVSSPSLEIIEPDKNLKGKLWASLKKVYNL